MIMGGWVAKHMAPNYCWHYTLSFSGHKTTVINILSQRMFSYQHYVLKISLEGRLIWMGFLKKTGRHGEVKRVKISGGSMTIA